MPGSCLIVSELRPLQPAIEPKDPAKDSHGDHSRTPPRIWQKFDMDQEAVIKAPHLSFHGCTPDRNSTIYD